MKRLPLIVLCLAVFAPHSAATIAQPLPPLDEAVQSAVDQAASSLQQSTKAAKVKRIGVIPLRAAPGVSDDVAAQAHRLLQAKLTETKFDVVLLADVFETIVIPEVVKELKIEDLIDPDTRKELKLASIEALVYGWVEKAEAGKQTALVQLNIRLVEIATGQVLWAATPAIAVDRRSSWPIFLGIAGGVIVICLIGIAVRRASSASAHRRGIDRQIQGGKAERSKAVDELKRVRDVLGRVQSTVRSDNQQLAGEVKAVSVAADELASKIKNAPAGNERPFKDGSVPRDDLDKLIALDTMIDGLLDEVTREALRLEEGGEQDRNARLATIRSLIAQIDTRFSERGDFLKRTG